MQITSYLMVMSEKGLEQMAKNLAVCSERTIRDVLSSLSEEQAIILQEMIANIKKEKLQDD